MATFFGWIPNVAGKLSFTLTGTSAYPRKFSHSADIMAGGRYFVGYQHRNLSDTTIPVLADWPMMRSIVDNIVFNKDGNFIFLCLFKITTDREEARGRIYAFSKTNWSETYPKIRDRLFRISEYWSDDTPLATHFPVEELRRAFYSARFAIKRNGIVEIGTLERSDDRNEQGEKIEHAFAAQAYFCLRDMLHTHRFHYPTSDTIIDVYRSLDQLKEQVSYGLMKRALAARRVQRLEAQHRALGIISYLKSFRENILNDEDRARYSFSIEAVTSSIDAGLPLVAAKEQNSFRQKVDRVHKWLIGFIAFIFTYAALVKDSKVFVPESLPWMKGLFIFIQEQIGIALICAVLVGWFLQAFLSVGFERRDAIVRTSSRLALAFQVRRYAMFEIVVGAITLALAMALVAWMVHSALSGPGEA